MRRSENIQLQFWRGSQPASTVVLCLHGIESHAGWFETFAHELCRLGVDCASYDRSGSGARLLTQGGADSEDQILADLLQAISESRSAYQRLIILGMSWGGLLAAFLLAKNPTISDHTVLLAPGIFPARQFPTFSMLKAAAGLIINPSLRIELPFKPEDFSADAEVSQWIEADRLRRTKVSARLLATTLAMQRQVRSTDYNGVPVDLWLPDEDAIIDTAKTLKFAAAHKIQIRTFKGRSHCLILECPGEIAAAVHDLAMRIGPP